MYNKGNDFRNNRSGGNRPYNRPTAPSGGSRTVQAEPLPKDYVDCAERVIGQHSGITTSKLRNLLSQFVDAYNRETLRTEETLTQESMDALTMARIRILYEAGRDNNVKSFVEAAKLLPYLKDIRDSRDKLIQYYHYLEALVAYQKFYGGKEN